MEFKVSQIEDTTDASHYLQEFHFLMSLIKIVACYCKNRENEF